jgi:hypothetical protein
MRLTRAQHAAAMQALADDDVRPYLTAHSDLPGPRGNLELIAAAADVLARRLALELADEADEYLRCCGVATLGRWTSRTSPGSHGRTGRRSVSSGCSAPDRVRPVPAARLLDP